MASRMPEVDLNDPQVVIELFEQAAEQNLESADRQGNVVIVKPGMDLQGHTEGRMIVSGDLHNHGHNLLRLVKTARVYKKMHNHLVFQEVAHGSNLVNGHDLSIRMLARVASLIVAHPGRVHQLISNHELAHLTGEGILKDGVDTVARFNEGVDFLFGGDAPLVQQALKTYVRSLPLAIRTPGGVQMSHSLPSPRQMPDFDPAVMDRLPTDKDLTKLGDVHRMVWGRNLTEEAAAELAEAWGVRLFVIGHMAAEMGWDRLAPNILVVASDHDHGCVLRFNIADKVEMADLMDGVMPLASVPV